MHNNILAEDDLRETSDYIDRLTKSTDNTNGAESDEHTAKLVRKSIG